MTVLGEPTVAAVNVGFEADVMWAAQAQYYFKPPVVSAMVV